MKRVIFILGILFCFACNKTEIPKTPPVVVVQEEAIKFTTNLDTGTYNVVDTLPLIISVTSKIPSTGFLYTIIATWTDSSKQIFKLDTSLMASSLGINIPGLKNTGNYNLSITVASKSTFSNSLNKSIQVVNNPLGRFIGYKVDLIEKAKNEVNYWRDCGVVWDIIAFKFLVNLKGGNWNGFLPQLITGDFNKDGWIDIFNPGVGTFNGVVNDKFQWLIWNPQTKIFDNKNLLNDKSLVTFGGNQRRTISLDLNKDGYTDNVIIDHGDDINFSLPRQPIRIMLSDGKGGYNLQEIKISDSYDFFHSGDIGDLNNDGLPDLVVGTPNQVIIAWGDNTSSFFGSIKRSSFNSFSQSDNGFGEWFPEISGQSYNITINDINKDGWNDLIVGSDEDYTKSIYKYNLTTKIALNQGGGKFNKNGYIPLPVNWRMKDLNSKNNFLVNDFRVADINNDGLNDIIATASFNYDDFNFFAYIQTSQNQFKIDTTIFKYTINNNRRSGSYGTSWKPWIIYYDFNGDKMPDISYIDPHNYWNNSLSRKSVFIKSGNHYVEDDFYKYDHYAKSIKPK
jgi:hypothetical protein